MNFSWNDSDVDEKESFVGGTYNKYTKYQSSLCFS